LSGGGRPRWGDFTGGAFPGQDPPAAPRPPQGRPVHVVDVTDDHARTVAARYADVALVRATTPVQAAGERDRLLEQAGSFGRRPGSARILVSLLVDLGDGERAAEPGHGGGGPRPTGRGPLYRGGPVDLAELIAAWHAAGVADGFHLVPVEPRRDLERLVNGTAALLQHRGLFRTFYPGSTLREHLGLPRPVTPYATSGATLTASDHS
ncbi:LLM class flavin-dependent oxidoreductase, partial [Streptomyces sp. SID161]|uniref:LLM class flavin-dependent oxidoreductase n=1 Tax=Streptomyces sp. SID161 TaxID=2690251 RepID=UPI0013696F7E